MAQLDDGTGTASPNQGGGSAAGGPSDVGITFQDVPTIGGGSSSDVEITFADVEKIGGDTAALSGEATAAKAALADASGHSAAFGSYPPARALYSHHQAVVNVFAETLGAIATDLDDFGNTIVQAAHAHEQTDDDVRASLASVATGLDPRGLWDKYVEARNQQGHQLKDVEIDDPQALAGQNPDLNPDAVDALTGTQHDRDASAPRGGFQTDEGR